MSLGGLNRLEIATLALAGALTLVTAS